jgi:hypothetical protein
MHKKEPEVSALDVIKYLSETPIVDFMQDKALNSYRL